MGLVAVTSLVNAAAWTGGDRMSWRILVSLRRDQHGSVASYCKARWGMSHRHANRLIGAREVTTHLGPTGPVMPVNERQALAAFEPG
jgi:hypothetical protein